MNIYCLWKTNIKSLFARTSTNTEIYYSTTTQLFDYSLQNRFYFVVLKQKERVFIKNNFWNT